jgi:hypothetical protein
LLCGKNKWIYGQGKICIRVRVIGVCLWSGLAWKMTVRVIGIGEGEGYREKRGFGDKG